ncbi:unnamed protein product [Rotaria sp. Silwood1]|nr:unnamed protein product [Rotaria sp. Silwood1]CAF3893606.1 unnamed protein product [Rotaria sp. Silwood1]CAF3988719.1 unnamed protein product [Rotaria sp. Silwood1]
MASLLVLSLASAQRFIIRYIDSCVFSLGAIGSLMNIVLFSRRHLRANSCCTYFLASSFAALVLISFGIIPLIYAQFYSPNPFFTINAFCKIRAYINQWSAMSCRWLLAMACVDRCVACSENANIRHFFTVKKSWHITILIVFVWMVFPVHALIFANIIPPGNIGCIMTPNVVAIYHGFYTIIMGGTFPPLIMLISTLFIWRSLKKRNKRRALINVAGTERWKNSRDQQVLIILLAQVAIFLISAIPFMANNIYTSLTRDIPNKSADRKAIEGFCQVIAELFVYLYPASTFYSNTLVSGTFRKELLNIFTCFKSYYWWNKNRVTTITHTRTNNGTQEVPLTTTKRSQVSPYIPPRRCTNV